MIHEKNAAWRLTTSNHLQAHKERSNGKKSEPTGIRSYLIIITHAFMNNKDSFSSPTLNKQ